MIPSEQTVELYNQLQAFGVDMSIEKGYLRIDGAKKLSPSQIATLRAKKSEFMHLVEQRQAITDTIKIYTDAVQQLYRDNAHILHWARSHEDPANTIEPLLTVQQRLKQAKREAEAHLTVESLHKLDYELYEMESVFHTLKSIYDAT